MLGTPVPKVTAATAFLGTFNAFAALGRRSYGYYKLWCYV